MKMPVDRLKNQSEFGINVSPGTHQETALRVLANNPETAYRPSQIEKETDIPSGSGPKVMNRLAENEVVESIDGYYFVVEDHLSEV